MHKLRSDHADLAIVHTDTIDWQPSPSPGVWRKRLELYGPAEAGRVTSVVRYDPGSSFRPHPHPDGEEILVLSGVFSDERGDHPAGTWLLNPEGFTHAPGSEPGCTLLVKLRQYGGEGRPQVALNTRDPSRWRAHAVEGVRTLTLYEQAGFPETTRLTRIAPGAVIPPQVFPGGEEIFVLEGAFSDEHGDYREGSWVRYPPGSGHTPRTETGCLLFVKKDHLMGGD